MTLTPPQMGDLADRRRPQRRFEKKCVASLNRQQMKNRRHDGQKSKSARSDAGGHFHPLPVFAPVYPAMLVVKVALLPAPPAAPRRP